MIKQVTVLSKEEALQRSLKNEDQAKLKKVEKQLLFEIHDRQRRLKPTVWQNN